MPRGYGEAELHALISTWWRHEYQIRTITNRYRSPGTGTAARSYFFRAKQIGLVSSRFRRLSFVCGCQKLTNALSIAPAALECVRKKDLVKVVA